MSFFSAIANAEHSFAAWCEKELQKLYSAAPKIEQVADTVLTYVGPVLQMILTATAGAPAAAIIGKVIAQAQSDLTAASGLIHDFGPTPSVASIITSVTNNLSGLLTAGHVTDPKSVAAAQKVVAELSILATALEALATPPATPAAEPAAEPAPAA